MAGGDDFGKAAVPEIADRQESSRNSEAPASEHRCGEQENETVIHSTPGGIGHHAPENEAVRHSNPDGIGPEQVKTSAAESSSEQSIPVKSDESRRRKMGGEWFRLNHSCMLALHRGDITKWKVDGKIDAIVNAANKRMLGGGGVDGAIHRAAGPELYDACYELPLVARGVRCHTGEAVITDGFRLPVSKIIHTVGPIYKDEETSAPLLERSYKSVMLLAVENGIKYVAFPALSCGIYDYPHDEAAEIALRTVNDNAHGLKEVHFVLFEEGTWVQWLSKANRSFEKIL